MMSEDGDFKLMVGSVSKTTPSEKRDTDEKDQNSTDHQSIKSDKHQIASFHQDANRAETREYETHKKAIDISSQKPDIDKITYSKLSGKN